MNNVKQWLSLTPVDTLFFRGSEPMVVGENHEVSTVFPPMPSTLMGAICSAILAQRGIRPADFVNRTGPSEEITEKYPLLGQPGQPRFSITGPLFAVSTGEKSIERLFPCPANWFGNIPATESQDSLNSNGKISRTMTIFVADMNNDLVNTLGLSGSVPNPPLILEPKRSDLKSLAGCWINLAALNAVSTDHLEFAYCDSIEKLDSAKPSIVSPGAIYTVESRVGIAIEKMISRTAKGHLFSSGHVRLQNSVSILVGLSQNLVDSHLNPTGVMSLGGEQRQVSYRLVTDGMELSSKMSSKIMSLSPFPLQDLQSYGWEDLPRSSGPILKMGGWDMQLRFHKPCRAFLPAGTVIFNHDNQNVPFGFINL